MIGQSSDIAQIRKQFAKPEPVKVTRAPVKRKTRAQKTASKK